MSISEKCDDNGVNSDEVVCCGLTRDNDIDTNNENDEWETA